MSKLKPLGHTTAPKPKTHKPIYNPSLRLQGTKEGKAYLSHIRKMDPFDQLIYWITERHRIHCQRFGLTKQTFGQPRWIDAGGVTGDHIEQPRHSIIGPPITAPPKPWTPDPLLKTIFFCNPYRENDKVTGYLRDNFREEYKDKPCVFLGTILLRLFNYIPTMRRLINAGIPQRLDPTSSKECKAALRQAEKILVPLRDNGEQMFSGAYIIKFFNGMRKVEALFQVMNSLVDACTKHLYRAITLSDFAEASKTLISIRGMGPFYVYQILGDLAYTHVLEKAHDWKTWGFCGPGTSRGLLRLRGITTKPNGQYFERRIDKPRGWDEQLQELLKDVNGALIHYHADGTVCKPKHVPHPAMPEMHMRDLCNCLCEYDKYCRALNNERHVKRPYLGEC